MNILYYGYTGTCTNLTGAIISWVIASIILIIGIILSFSEDKFCFFGSGFILALIFTFIGLNFYKDTRVPIVKATIDDSVPWAEINERYTLKAQEGQIYTFKVKNVDIEEWVAQYGE